MLLHGHQIWLSELLAVSLVTAMLLALGGMGGAIAANAARLAREGRQLAALESGETDLRNRLDRVKEQDRLLSAFRQLAGSRLPAQRLNELVALVDRSSQKYGYDALLVLAVIRVESRYDPRALGRFRSGKESGAMGLMQITFETARIVARELGMTLTDSRDLFRPEVNIALGVAYLTKLIGQFHTFKLGLMAYNLGPGVVEQSIALRRPLPMAYYEKVLTYYYRLRKAADEAGAAWE
jgi:soluble lytic murein transglycosylase-like protein